MKEGKKEYQAPKVYRVRLDIKSSVMGSCQQSPENVIAPFCDVPGASCPTAPHP